MGLEKRIIAKSELSSIGTASNRIVDHFTYTPRSGNDMENENEDAQWEFLVIGGRVPWNEALAICPIYGHLNPLSVLEEAEMGYDEPPDSPRRETETDLIASTLAVLDDDTMDWLARMVSESNYRLLDYFIPFYLFPRQKDMYVYKRKKILQLRTSESVRVDASYSSLGTI